MCTHSYQSVLRASLAPRPSPLAPLALSPLASREKLTRLRIACICRLASSAYADSPPLAFLFVTSSFSRPHWTRIDNGKYGSNTFTGSLKVKKHAIRPGPPLTYLRFSRVRVRVRRQGGCYPVSVLRCGPL